MASTGSATVVITIPGGIDAFNDVARRVAVLEKEVADLKAASAPEEFIHALSEAIRRYNLESGTYISPHNTGAGES